MSRPLIAVCATALLLAACGGGACTLSLLWGVSVRVIDARTDAGICDAGVVISEGAFSERLQAFDTNPASCEYVGAAERAGTYRIAVEHPDFVTATVDNVVVTANQCHVMQQKRTVTLQPR